MALSLAACGGEDNTPFSQVDVDAAKAEGIASVDITSDNADAVTAALTGTDGTVYATVDAAVTAGAASVDITSDNADAVTAALTAADGTTYATVDAAYTAGSNVTNAAAVEAALTDASGVKHNNVDVAITSNDAAIETAATASAEAALVAGSGFATVADLLAAYTAAVAPDGAASLALTSSTDVLTAFTGSNDTVTGAFGTVQSADVIVDSSTTDSDVGTFTVADAINVTVSNIETVTFDIRDTNAASTILLDKVTGANNIILTSSYGTTDIEAEKLGQGQKVTFADTDFTTVSVNSGGDSDSATNNVHVVLDGAFTITSFQTAESNFDVDGLTIETKTGASTVDLTAGDDFIASTTVGSLDTEYITATGDQNLTLIVDSTNNAAGLDGAIVNNNMTGDATLTVKLDTALASAELDLDSVSADTIEIAAAAAANTTFKLSSGASVKNSTSQAAAADLVFTTTDEDSTLTVTSTDALHATGIKTTNFDTVNINGDADSTAEDFGDIEVTNADIGDSVTVNVTTGGGIEVGAVAAAAGSTLSALNVTGDGAFTGGALAATNIDISAKSIVAATMTGVVNLNATGAITMSDAITGAATITSTGGLIDVDEIASATKAVVINMNDQAGVAVDALNGDGIVAGTLTINGAGTFATGDNITADTVTVTGAVALDMATGSDTLTGDFVSTSSKAQSLNVVTGDVDATGATGGVTVASATGADGTSFKGGAGNDSITAATADAGASWVITGGDGNDTLDIGGETTQNGSLSGGAGIDTLQGGDGVGDVLTGGTGTDTFQFESVADGGTLGANDTITDFEVGSAGDVLQSILNADFTSDGATVVKVDTTDVGTSATDGTDVLLMTGTGYASEAALLTALTGASGIAATAGNALNSAKIMVVWYDTTNSTVQVSQANETDGNDDVLNAIGTSFVSMSNLGLADIADMTADNFVIA